MRVARLSDWARWLLGRYQRVRVHGASMAPTLSDGQDVLVDLRALGRRKPAVGDVLLARHPFRSDIELIKRVARMEADGSCFVVGDGAESTDSRAFGALPAGHLLGLVVARLPN